MPTSEPESGSGRSSYSANAAFWIKIIQEELDPYRTQLTDAAVTRAVAPRPGMTILDAGCGEGYLSRMLARHGPAVIGVDACQELIDAAIAAAEDEQLDAEYHVSGVEALPLANGSADVVVCNHLLNDLDHLDRPFEELRRVLGAAGRLVILMLHPCFYVPHSERDSGDSSLSAEQYFAGRTIEQAFSVAGTTSPATVRVQVRPLEEITGALSRTGFVITSLSEPHPTPQQIAADPWWASSFPRPMFMLLTAAKRPW